MSLTTRLRYITLYRLYRYDYHIVNRWQTQYPQKKLRERQDEYTYVDVREADELGEGMIDGAMNIPLGQLISKTW